MSWGRFQWIIYGLLLFLAIGQLACVSTPNTQAKPVTDTLLPTKMDTLVIQIAVNRLLDSPELEFEFELGEKERRMLDKPNAIEAFLGLEIAAPGLPIGAFDLFWKNAAEEWVYFGDIGFFGDVKNPQAVLKGGFHKWKEVYLGEAEIGQLRKGSFKVKIAQKQIAAEPVRCISARIRIANVAN